MNYDNIRSQVNRRVVELTAGGFQGARAVLDRYRQGEVYVAGNSLSCRVIEQACDRLNLTYTVIGNTYIISE